MYNKYQDKQPVISYNQGQGGGMGEKPKGQGHFGEAATISIGACLGDAI